MKLYFILIQRSKSADSARSRSKSPSNDEKVENGKHNGNGDGKIVSSDSEDKNAKSR